MLFLQNDPVCWLLSLHTQERIRKIIPSICMHGNYNEKNSRHPFPDHLLSLYHIYLLLCSIKVLFYLLPVPCFACVSFFDYIFVRIFLEVCIIFHAVRWVNLGIMDMHIRILVSTLEKGYHCTCTMCCNTVEAVENVCIYSSSSSPQLPLLRRST